MNLYKITERQLGAGSFGRVHLAIDLFRQRQMACKIVALKDECQTWTGGRKVANSLWREVKLLKEISHVRKYHPLIEPCLSCAAQCNTCRASILHREQPVGLCLSHGAQN